MGTGLVVLVMVLFVPIGVILWNKQRTKGKLLCTMVKDDKSTDTRLCRLDGGFVIYQERAYDVYPDLIRVTRFPGGWPTFLQELVPHALYDESDGIPLDWVNLGDRQIRSMELKAALDENFFRKIVHETVTEGKGFSFNWKKMVPYGLLVIGVMVLLYLVMF